jgi:poly(hydroxyalkanoate) depolymerase family esterase
MRKLGDLTAQLSRSRRRLEDLLEAARKAGRGPTSPRQASASNMAESRLRPVASFGSNPGELRMLAYRPDGLAEGAPLVVVLHGCTQTAADYDQGAGWSTLADRHGFAVLMPEQQRSNNPKCCFSWFQPGDTARDAGEAMSIRQMVERMITDHRLDRDRVFITGLSAGGAMTAAMLATYPEVFAAGAIIAGLPYGTASNVQDAFESMFQGRVRSPRQWGDKVRAASAHMGPWPRVSIWHGSADATVKPGNAQELIKQWTDLHGLPLTPTDEARVAGYPRSTWAAPDGTALVESYSITGMAHGTPLSISQAQDPDGAAGPFMLDVGIASGDHIARFFGIAGAGVPLVPVQPVPRLEPIARPQAETSRPEEAAPPRGVDAIIKDALRAAGLLKD